MQQRIELTHEEMMSFSTEVNGHKIILDADESVGGNNRGPRPKPFMLVALAGCTAMDVISILRKMKVEPEGFRVGVEADLSDEHPKVYTRFHITYLLKGKGLEPAKVEKAVALSQEKYCGVSAMCRQVAEITHEIKIEE